MAAIPALVDQALRAANIPIESVSFVQTADRATWTIQFLPSATDPQKVQAQTILNTIVTDATALHAQDRKDVQAYIDNLPLVEKAVDLTILDQVNFIRSKLPTPLVAITPQQWVDAVKAKVNDL